jgi:hypothetical protein
MTKHIILGVLVTACLALAGPSHAARTDAIWARSTNGASITLDGQLNEAAWAAAESTVIRFGIDAGVPGSGAKFEAGRVPSDSTHATLKFLTVGNQLYLGAFMRDKSIGGSGDFNLFDGLLMDLKNHSVNAAPKPPAEYLYGWWYEGATGTPPINQPPAFKGLWAELPVGSPRTPAQIAAWDAVTTVIGTANSDTTLDTGYVIEMRFDLGVMGYDITDSDGDVIEWNVSIYDCDWNWPLDGARFSANRVWWQDPWGNVGWYGQVRIHARPGVHVASGPAPVIAPELILPRAGVLAAPVIDGNLNDPVWAQSPSLLLKYGDDAVRAGYGNPGQHRAGQHQPSVNEGLADVVDPGDATVKYIVKDNWLYFGFDVRDQVVQNTNNPERRDGFSVMLTEKVLRGPDRELLNRQLSFEVSPTGTALAGDYLPFLRDSLAGAQVALLLKPGTTVDTVGFSPDQGYTAELAVDLTKLGYPSGLGDGIVHMGLVLYDGDSFGSTFTDSYATRTWWWRERANTCCPVWAYADPTAVVAVGDPPPGAPGAYAILGASPNPVRSNATVRIQLARASRIVLETYDVAGRKLLTQNLGIHPAGAGQIAVPRAEGPGLILYRLFVTDPGTGEERATLSGKLTFVK